MRIRKRQVHFSSSSESISPLHLSDPHLMNRSPVVVQHNEGIQAHTPSLPSQQHGSAGLSLNRYQPSDQTLPLIRKLNNGYDYPSEESGVHKYHNKLDPLDEKVRGQEKRSDDSGGSKSNHTSKGDILVDSQVLPSSSTFEQDGIWCEGEKAIPLKKRKGRFENIGMESDDSKKMKTKMNKKCSKGKDDDDDDEEESERKVNVKKRVTKRGSAVMEGSRCSRVNGRGWRCCQQTLVGYSLCEHHLGKGRLRSMTSVRNKSNIGLSTAITATNNVVHSANSSSNSDLEKKIMFGNGTNDKLDDDDDDEKKKPEVIIAKKRMKLGIVKARSMSSLLGQIDNKVVVDHDNENNK